MKKYHHKTVVGERFGLLVVTSDNGLRNKHFERVLTCKCDCGNETTAIASRLNYGKKRSCGCLQKNTRQGNHTRTHGDAGVNQAPEYTSWCILRSRCSNPNNNRFKYYGGRGIKVCDRWLKSYENFLADMGRKPSPEHSIDRIDVNGNYEPDNCRWATPIQQRANRRDSHAEAST